MTSKRSGIILCFFTFNLYLFGQTSGLKWVAYFGLKFLLFKPSLLGMVWYRMFGPLVVLLAMLSVVGKFDPDLSTT